MEFSESKRISPRLLETSQQHWANTIAEQIIHAFPSQTVYTVAAGISPSGVVHFGNFRDVMTSYAVLCALKEKGKQVQFVFSWDNFDRLRKIPTDIDVSFAEHIGKPISQIPDPAGKYTSYAQSFQIPFEQSMKELGISLEYKDQTALYTTGAYAEKVILAMQKKDTIGEIVFSLMSEKAIAEKELTKETFLKSYYPISIYSRFTGKDFTEIKEFDGASLVTYLCKETGKTDTIDLKKDFCYKLPWKIDWPMRWIHEGVVFEPGGHDHASPGSSFDVSSAIAKALFGEPPVFVEYKFIGIQGMDGKMSGSKGGAVTPAELLHIYEPRLLKWLYLRKIPSQQFQLAFDTEIYRQYEEYDTQVATPSNSISEDSIKWSLAENETAYKKPTSFRHIVAFGQIMQWDVTRMKKAFEFFGASYDEEALLARIPKARAWLELYNKEEMIIVRDSVNTAYAQGMSPDAKNSVQILLEALEKNSISEDSLEEFLYSIPKDDTLSQKENASRQRAFFKDIYNLLISKDTGPRLATFIAVIGYQKTKELLTLS